MLARENRNMRCGTWDSELGRLVVEHWAAGQSFSFREAGVLEFVGDLGTYKRLG